MRITDEKISAYNAIFEVSPSRFEYLGGGNGFGSSYYLFILPKTTLSNVFLTTGFSDDPNSEAKGYFTEFVYSSAYSSTRDLQSIYNAVSKIAVSDKSKIKFTSQGTNEFEAVYFTDSYGNKYVIVFGQIKTVSTNLFVSVSCSTSNAIVTDSWFLLKNGETQDLMYNTPLLVKPNFQQAISVGTDYVIEKPGIVYHATYNNPPQIKIVNPGDVLSGGYLYYLIEIA